MAHAEESIARMRAALARRKGIAEKKMFGGICFMLNDHMLCAASSRGFMIRVGEKAEGGALRNRGVKPMEMRGRVYRGYIRVDPDACADIDLKKWLALAAAFVGSLPAKPPRPTVRKKRPRPNAA